MFINYEVLKSKMVGEQIPKPLNSTLSGHAAGEPFDKLANKYIKEQYPEDTYRQYEYLNYLFSKNQDAKTLAARRNLFDSPTILFLLERGKNATENWSLEHLFDEKQNDTADILVTKNNKFELIDIKTRNSDKKAQPPNIISAYKLARTCAKMIDNKDYDIFDINYFQVEWKLIEDKLECTDTAYAELFKCDPSNLYINWAAAMQIQFHVDELDQTYTKTREEWAREYLRHFTSQAKIQSEKMIEKFVKPFEKYL